jgi:uncharacterized protein YqeY
VYLCKQKSLEKVETSLKKSLEKVATSSEKSLGKVEIVIKLDCQKCYA